MGMSKYNLSLIYLTKKKKGNSIILKCVNTMLMGTANVVNQTKHMI